MQDSFQLPSNDNDNWLMYPGAKIEPACRLTDSALHFTGMLNDQAVTTRQPSLERRPLNPREKKRISISTYIGMIWHRNISD